MPAARIELRADSEAFIGQVDAEGRLSRGQVAGLAFLHDLLPTDREQFVERLIGAAEKKEGLETTYRSQTGDGFLLIRGAPAMTGDGALSAYALVVSRSQFADELGEWQEEAERFLGALWKPVIAINTQGRIVFMNEAACRRLGVERPQDQPPAEKLLVPDLASGTFAEMLTSIFEGSSWLGRLAPVGGARPAPLRSLGIWRWNGEQCAFLVGPTARPEHTSEHDRPEDCPECASDQVRTLLLSALSHELDAPVGLLGQTAVVFRKRLESGDFPTAIQLAMDILAQSDRIRGVYRNVKLLTDLGEELQLEPVLVERAVSEAVAEHLSRHPDRQVTVRVGKPGCVVQADPVALGEVMLNLLGNAEKFSSQDEEIGIEVGSEPEGDVVVRILDRGPGIAAGDAEKVFDAFYRGRSTKHTPGLGLGLAVSRQLLERMGGALEALRRDGGGTVFELHLPAAATTASGRMA